VTSKERAKLRSLAANENALFQVGKGGISDELVKGIGEALDKRELVKISALKTCPYEPEELLALLAEKLGAQSVAVTGSKLVLYRRSQVKGAAHIQL